MRFRFRPKLLPTLITLPMLAALLALGTWQVERLHWKEVLIETRAERLAAAPITPSDVPADPSAAAYRRIRLDGRFDHAHQMFLVPRSLRGEVGAHLITPLQLNDGSWVMVDRGWVPDAWRGRGSASASTTADDRVAVSGVLRVPTPRGYFVPEDQPEDNLWFAIDPPAMAAHAAIDPVHGWYVEAGPGADPAAPPIGGQTITRLANNHLQYALTWYGLAVALTVIYLVYHLRRDEP